MYSQWPSCRLKKLPELPPFHLDCTRIKQVHEAKYLGLTADDNMCRDAQCKSVKGKVAGGLALIRRLKSILPQS